MVSAIISRFIPFKIYGVIVLIISIIGLVGYKFYEVKTLQNEVLRKDIEIKDKLFVIDKAKLALNDVLRLNKMNQISLKKLDEEYQDSLKILNEYYEEKLKRNSKFIEIKEKIQNDKKINDAPAAVVLIRNTSSLWELIKNSRSSKDCRKNSNCKNKDTK